MTADEVSISFQHESGIYGDATIMEGEDSVISEVGRPGPGGIEPSVQGFRRPSDQTQHPANQPYLEKFSQIFNDASGFVKSTVIVSGKIVNNMFGQIGDFVKQTPRLFIMAILFVVCASLLLRSPVIQETAAARYIGSCGLDVKHYLGRFVPKPIAHPLNYFAEKDIFDLQSRMSDVEYDLVQLKKSSNLNQASIDKLEELVPDFVVCKKDKTGAVQVPRDFWLALKDKIQGDPSLLRSPAIELDNPKHIAGHDLTVKDVKEIATGIWSNFIRQNNVQIKTLYSDAFDDLWARRLKDALKNNVVVSKPEFIEAIQKNWEDSRSLVDAQVSQLAANIEQTIKAAKQQTSGFTEKEVKLISETVFRQLVPRAQLEALANAKIQHSIDYSLLRFNHFSPGGGAVINPSLISPTYQPPKRPGFLARLLLGLRPPNPAVEVLTKWDEAGECWCAPSEGTHSGIQLGVLIASDIYPDEIVVEHIPKTATLDPGSTPRQMELFAQIRGDALGAVGELSSRLFPDAPVEIDLDETWIRLAVWEFDLDGARAQAFPVAIDLKALKVSVKQLVVRARTNWGGEREVAGTDHTCLYRVRVHGDIAV
jgi:hypothetical protein